MHNLEYYCEDALGHETPVHVQYYKVDDTSPETTKTYIPEEYIDQATGYEYIDTVHEIELTAEDGGEICAIGVGEIQYRVSGALSDNFCQNCENWMSMLRPDIGPWNTYEGPFGIDEESCHVIEYRSIDGLGNTEEIEWQCVFVDKSKPEIDKKYFGPYFDIEAQDWYAEWINSETVVGITVTDPEPHPAGLADVKYRVSLVDDEYCKEYFREDLYPCEEAEGIGLWMTVNPEDFDYFEFQILDDSCHLIEVYAEDNVGKFNNHKQCVYVDNQGPDPLKTVGDPKIEWDGMDAYYYDLEKFCETPGNCYKITTTTPIKMDCVDPDPHPVDHENVCFKVELDGDDFTEMYCSEGYYDGSLTYNEEMGKDYCCVEGTVDVFYFHEESEHNLDFYCVDALGNKGDRDDEKFKVGGGKFRLELCKKWNLVSVPFVLLDNDIEVVFDDISEEVMAVWTYDNGEWLVWTPGEGPDSLSTIDPGWGYWVLMDNCTDLIVGGSLLSEGPNGPPSKDMTEGWNLIGYYGATSMYTEPQFEGDGMCEYDCDMYWDMYGYDSYEDCVYEECGFWYGEEPVYCALNSLVDTQQGFPRWSALWGYYHECEEECNTHGYWDGLNACCDSCGFFTWCPDYMEAGQGYWIEMDVEESYSPATNCIWNEDMTCVWGGYIV